jgi:hypothetical protein
MIKVEGWKDRIRNSIYSRLLFILKTRINILGHKVKLNRIFAYYVLKKNSKRSKVQKRMDNQLVANLLHKIANHI